MLSNKIEKYFYAQKKEIESIVDLESLRKYNVKIVKYDDKTDTGNIVELSDPQNTGKRILATYHIAGYYNLTSSIWVWSWHNPYLEKNLSLKIKNKTLELQKEIKGDKNKEIYNYFINEDTLFITGDNIDELMMFILFVSEGLWVISKKQENANILEILVLDKIVQNK